METNVMQKQIMRRVYYSYALSIATHTMLFRGMFLGVAAVLLADWLHVASIFSNLLAIPVGNVPSYVFSAFTHAAGHGELITVVLMLSAGLVALSSGWRIVSRLPLTSGVLRFA